MLYGTGTFQKATPSLIKLVRAEQPYHSLFITMKKSLLVPLAYLAYVSSTQAVEVGQPTPDCSATIATGNSKLDMSTYQGKVVLVDFWATWCPPCKKSMPFLNSLRNQLAKDGFEVVAINVDENSDEAKEYVANNPVDYKMAFDPSGDCPNQYQVKAMPSSYLIDKTGKIRHVHLGFRDEDQPLIREQVSSLLSE